MTASRDNTQALSDAIDVLRQHRWRFVLPAFAVAVLVLVGGLMLPRKHKAEAHFERRTDVVLTEMTSRGASDAFTDTRGTMQNAIVGRPAIQTAVLSLEPELRDIGVLKPGVTPAQYADQLSYDLLVHWDVRSPELDRVRIEYTGPDAQAATLLVNALVSGYIERTRSAMEDRLNEAAEFFDFEVKGHASQLEKYEAQLLRFEIEHGDLLPDHPGGLPQKLELAQVRLADLQAQRDTLARRIDALTAAVNEEPATISVDVHGKNPELTRLETAERDLDEKLSELLTTFKMKEAHPDVTSLRAELQRVQEKRRLLPAQVRVSTQSQPNPKRAELELRLTQLKADAKATEDQATVLGVRVASMQSDAGQLYPVRTDHRRLQRDVQEAQQKISFWQDNLRRINLALTAESGNRGVQLNFLQPATANPVPVSPNVYQVFAAAIILGTGAGVLGLFLAHRGDRSIQSREKLAQVGQMPVLGTVSELMSDAQRRLRRLRHLVLYPVAGSGMLATLLVLATILYYDVHEPQQLDPLKNRVADAPAAPNLAVTTVSAAGWAPPPTTPDPREVR